MDRDKEPLTARLNRRPSTSLTVRTEPRKPQFTGSEMARDGARSAMSMGSSPQSEGRNRNSLSRTSTTPLSASQQLRWMPPGASAGTTRRTISESHISRASLLASVGPPSKIPKPDEKSPFSRRLPMSLAEAYQRAEDEDHSDIMDDDRAQPSPSPAPRSWRATEATRRRQQIGRSNTTPDRSVSYAKSPGTKPGMSRVSSSLSNGSGIPELVPGIEDVPIPSVEHEAEYPSPQASSVNGRRVSSPRSPMSPTSPKSPKSAKSFNWQVDEDFTAGDLQVSDSPRLKTGTDSQPFANRLPFDDGSEVDINSNTRVNNPGSRNTKLDEIRSREVRNGNNVPLSPTNTRIDEIKTRENQAESQIPIPERRLSNTRNTKLEDIRQREQDGVPKRQQALAKLEDIKERNSMASSRSSEDKKMFSSMESSQESAQSYEEAKTPNDKNGLNNWDKISNIPITVFKKGQENGAKTPESNGRLSHRRSESRDLLRRLARAASSSPTQDESEKRRPNLLQKRDRGNSDVSLKGEKKTPESLSKSDKRSSDGSSLSSRASRLTSKLSARINERRSDEEDRGDRPRSRIGFPGLRRMGSIDSTKSKRSSIHSNADPTERISGEAKLFAPGDKFSEAASTRAPSPTRGEDEEKPKEQVEEQKEAADKDGDKVVPEVADEAIDKDGDKDSEYEKIEREDEQEVAQEKDVESTPKAKKMDPQTMPTPKITGAYVETPATVRQTNALEDALKDAMQDIAEEEEQEPTDSKPVAGKKQQALADIFGERSSSPPSDRDVFSDPETSDERQRRAKTTSSAAVKRRQRSLSLPRKRQPVKNTAKLPSVKDDLMELQRANNIDDSTLDDLEEILSGRKAAPAVVEKLLKDLPPAEDDSTDYELEAALKKAQEEKSRAENASAVNVKKEEGEEGGENSTENELEVYGRVEKKLGRALLGIGDSKKGIERHIERLQGNIDRLEDMYSAAQELKTEPNSPTTSEVESATTYLNKSETATSTQTSFSVPMPRFYTRDPAFRMTPLGIVVLLFSIWYAAESTTCGLYCRPAVCTTTPCVWSRSDPDTFGTAIPIKLDQWFANGQGRAVVATTLDNARDAYADLVDAVTGRSIMDADVQFMSIEDRRSHRRRLRKKGLASASAVQEEVPRETRERWDSWRREYQEMERRREMWAASGGSGGDPRVY